jgi:hypothetical protein
MDAAVTYQRPLVVAPGKPLRFRYALWIHANVPRRDEVEQQWQLWAKSPPPVLVPPHK